MRFRDLQYTEWNPLYLDPNALSDEQVEFFYQRALHEAADVEPYPPGTAGRMVTASSFVRLLQARHRDRQKHSKKPIGDVF